VAFQQKRRTQTAEYWLDEFAVHKEDIDYLYEWLLEGSEPRTIDELGCKVIERRCRKEEEALSRSAKGAVYQPKEKYDVGQRLVFPVLDYAVGEVLAVRAGINPRYGAFGVMKVQLEAEDAPREFVSEFAPDHVLNGSMAMIEQTEGLFSSQQLYEHYGQNVRQRLQVSLQQNEEFVRVGERWFLRGLMPEVTPFQLNIAEAMIDEKGKPLTISQLLEEVEFPEGSKVVNRAYALSHALSADPRFVKIGSGDEATWYISNLMPSAVRQKPAHLVPMHTARGSELLNRELHDFALEIADEADELDMMRVVAPGSVTSVQMVLTYPHRREGTLPLTARALSLVTENHADRFVVTFVDERNKEKMSGWMMPAEGYAWGLGEWYGRHGLPVGSTIELSGGDDPVTFRVSYDEGKRKSEWIRQAQVLNGRLTFGMQRKAYTCRYDKHLLFDEGSVEALDPLWTNSGAGAPSLFDLLCDLFPELAKLSSQGLVHAKTLYGAVNMTRRSGAVPVFAELTRRACFDPVGDGNWVFDETLRGTTYSTAEDMSRRPSSRRQDLIIDRVYPYGATIEG